SSLGSVLRRISKRDRLVAFLARRRSRQEGRVAPGVETGREPPVGREGFGACRVEGGGDGADDRVEGSCSVVGGGSRDVAWGERTRASAAAGTAAPRSLGRARGLGSAGCPRELGGWEQGHAVD